MGVRLAAPHAHLERKAMDPIEVVAMYIMVPERHRRIRRELSNRLRDWRASGGFRPDAQAVRERLEKTGEPLPANWAHVAKDLGCLG
jgi:hypothetical protein